MSDKSKIEWCDASWNPVTGCTKVSAGCRNCYAEREFPRTYPGRKFTDVRVHPDRLDQPLRWKRPRKIFVNSMSDLFQSAVPWDFIVKVFAVMDQARHHKFQVLTKRANQMLAFCRAMGRNPDSKRLILSAYGALAKPEILPNVWLGVSVEDQKTADERIALLLETPAAVRFVSYEPALGPIDFAGWLKPWNQQTEPYRYHALPRDVPGLNWLIAGGESGPNARPSHPDWFRAVRDQCQAAGVPFFFKQWGEWVGFEDSRGAFRWCSAKELYSWDGTGRCSYRIGKKRAGRLLDDREWSEFPAPAGRPEAR